jgi:hypothetical protein
VVLSTVYDGPRGIALTERERRERDDQVGVDGSS